MASKRYGYVLPSAKAYRVQGHLIQRGIPVRSVPHGRGWFIVSTDHKHHRELAAAVGRV